MCMRVVISSGWYCLFTGLTLHYKMTEAVLVLGAGLVPGPENLCHRNMPLFQPSEVLVYFG